MPIRFQADADLNQIIVSAVVRRVRAIDFRTATAAGLAGLKDSEVLAAAARDGRLLVTARPSDDASPLRRVRAVAAESWPHRRSTASLDWAGGRRPHSHLDGNKTGRMDGSNCVPADLTG
jgi:hypothetical protein